MRGGVAEGHGVAGGVCSEAPERRGPAAGGEGQAARPAGAPFSEQKAYESPPLC